MRDEVRSCNAPLSLLPGAQRGFRWHIFEEPLLIRATNGTLSIVGVKSHKKIRMPVFGRDYGYLIRAITADLEESQANIKRVYLRQRKELVSTVRQASTRLT